MSAVGNIRSVRDLVLKVRFKDEIPDVGEVIIVTDLEDKPPLVVDSFTDDSTALCLNLTSNRQLARGMKHFSDLLCQAYPTLRQGQTMRMFAHEQRHPKLGFKL